MPILSPTFFSDKMPNWIRNLMSKTKISVIHEKMGIWPQKWWNLSQKVDDKPSYHLERWKTTKVSSQLVVRWFNRKLIGGRKVDVTHEKMVTNDSESEVRSPDGPKWVKSSPWLSETDQQWWVMEKMLLNPSVSIRY